MRHEEAAAFAAGYAKFSGRLGVCLSTSGPGLIHMMNGLYDAKLDQVPVLAISRMPYYDLIGTLYQQDVGTVRLLDNVASTPSVSWGRHPSRTSPTWPSAWP